MASISEDKLTLVREMYNTQNMSMQDIATKLNVSLDSVVYFMRKHKINRRNTSDTNRYKYTLQTPSFSLNSDTTNEKLLIILAMLYWAEGYKTEKANGLDFANSDPDMIKTFITALRSVYCLDEGRLRVLLYCYQDQNVKDLISFWSCHTCIPEAQFTKPYIRKDIKDGGRKMPYGLIHIRYYDKKLLIELKKLIESYK
ncbi:hypothetical protein COW81_01580 [Candidatus Campbellbacteria bacterium CG22_combo_CG10-13_8_21_14_all_36_13]|uniref:Uncharacterized protein n=1 Tax=Candidatus Campbellbacteria bacterium CG22_combo_CG10-13_8_21_14_all_36_13 TaxID=1974529 RepID=A0A2H0DYE4_9BACT|nr:MAG: hypothetical protein COW81_01580 [Candidatus Campbellbacteria bacterium CG22_combo_CG10-13_8_21_14_all_36_13]